MKTEITSTVTGAILYIYVRCWVHQIYGIQKPWGPGP